MPIEQTDREAAQATHGWMGDELAQAFAAHRIAAEQRAVAEVVAWLREHSGSFKAMTVANAIEAGEHRKGTT